MNEVVETRLESMFPPPQDYMKGLDGKKLYEDRPLIVVDCKGKIVLWYLPNAIRQDRQMHFLGTAKHLEKAMTKPTGNGWRNNPSAFREPEVCSIRPGVVNLSPGWFMQGHEVSQHEYKM